MKETKLPPGWDDSRIKKVIAAYAQSEDEAVAEDEADIAVSEAVMNIPRELVPQVRELVAKRRL